MSSVKSLLMGSSQVCSSLAGVAGDTGGFTGGEGLGLVDRIP